MDTKDTAFFWFFLYCVFFVFLVDFVFFVLEGLSLAEC